MDRESRPLISFFATGFYSGYSRFAPGTCGTVVIAVLWYFLGGALPIYGGVLVTVLFIPLAVWVARRAVEGSGKGASEEGVECGNKAKVDPQEIVIDEFAGYLLAIAGVSVTWQTTLLAFLLFRLCDITKPPPARALERLPNGWGVVLDDVVAGLYANGVLRLILLWQTG